VQVTATHDHGMLSVSIPKMETSQSPAVKKITVKSAKNVIEGTQEQAPEQAPEQMQK
jgi:hypothetical protein